MEVLYRSKGISKQAFTAKCISIAICLAVAIFLCFLGGSKVDGPTQVVSIGGQMKHISLERSRFSGEQQQVMMVIVFMLGLYAVVDAVLLALYRQSWTEIYKDRIKACYMGKTVNYPMADITKISELKGHLIIEGASGKAGFIAEDPKRARRIVEQQMLRK